jgi:uncharacterized lipoprotein YmbA
MMGRILFHVLVAALTLSTGILGWCVNLGKGTQQTTRFYLLYPLSSLGTGIEATLPGPCVAIGVGPVKLPEYLNRPQIVTRSSPGELQVAEFARWAEPLEENFTRVLAENLSMLLPASRTVEYPWERSMRIDYQVRVDIIYFDGQPGGDVHLRTRWTLLGNDGKSVLMRKESNFCEPMDRLKYGELVSTQSRMIAQLSRRIATAIKTVSRQVPDRTCPGNGE